MTEPDYLDSDADLYEEHAKDCRCSRCAPEEHGPRDEVVFVPIPDKIRGGYQMLQYWRVEVDDAD